MAAGQRMNPAKILFVPAVFFHLRIQNTEKMQRQEKCLFPVKNESERCFCKHILYLVKPGTLTEFNLKSLCNTRKSIHLIETEIKQK